MTNVKTSRSCAIENVDFLLSTDGSQWRSGSVLDLRSEGLRFDTVSRLWTQNQVPGLQSLRMTIDVINK